VSACVEYYQFTGDISLLEQCYPYAIKNLQAYDEFLGPEGLADGIDWPFIDWGYVKKEGEIDLAMNLHLLGAYQVFLVWCTYLKIAENKPSIGQKEKQLRQVLIHHIEKKLEKGFASVGYHAMVLTMRLGLMPSRFRQSAVQYLKTHILHCFPNNPDAPRLSDPGANHEQLITPYFAHYAFEILIKEGEMGFVQDQYRTCWGWMLQQQSGTWLEVFDPRWSHCHQWSGCPTWQLSRYSLGLHPRMERGADEYDFHLETGSLYSAKGKLPLVGTGEWISVEWHRENEEIHYHLQTPRPIKLKIGRPIGRSEQITTHWKKIFPVQKDTIKAEKF
jgi:alpha-L-rhamnosidase